MERTLWIMAGFAAILFLWTLLRHERPRFRGTPDRRFSADEVDRLLARLRSRRSKVELAERGGSAH